MSGNPYIPPEYRNQQMWRKLLIAWLDLVERYENREGQEEQDFCYWYNERPNTGVLSAAAWVAGGWGLEEFSAKRRKKGKKKTGRPDLWFGIGDTEAAIEAKIAWVAGTFAAAREKAKKMLAEAGTQLEGLKRWERGEKGCQLVSVCFIVPYRKEQPEDGIGLGLLKDVQKWARSQGMATAIHISRKAKSTRPKKRNYPGVLLVAKQEDFSA